LKYRIIPSVEFKTVPWKNGKGITKELFVKHEKGRSEFVFRLSIAAVTENGPFSVFSGYNRVLMMLEGNGIRLEHSDGSINEIKSYSEMAIFSGDLKTEAVLKEGPIKDFNVMTLKEACSSEVIAINGEVAFTENSGELFILCCGDTVQVESVEKKVNIEHYHLLHITEIISGSIRVKGDAIAVRIIYHR